MHANKCRESMYALNIRRESMFAHKYMKRTHVCMQTGVENPCMHASTYVKTTYVF